MPSVSDYFSLELPPVRFFSQKKWSFQVPPTRATYQITTQINPMFIRRSYACKKRAQLCAYMTLCMHMCVWLLSIRVAHDIYNQNGGSWSDRTEVICFKRNLRSFLEQFFCEKNIFVSLIRFWLLWTIIVTYLFTKLQTRSLAVESRRPKNSKISNDQCSDRLYFREIIDSCCFVNE